MNILAIGNSFSQDATRYLNAIAKADNVDLTVVNLDEEWTVDPQKFVSKGKNNPFGGYKLNGVVKYTIVDGDVKYKA